MILTFEQQNLSRAQRNQRQMDIRHESRDRSRDDLELTGALSRQEDHRRD